MAKKKKKDEIVATVGLDGSITKNNSNNKQDKNVVASVGLDGSITPIQRNTKTNNDSVKLPIKKEQESPFTATTVTNNINDQISKNIVQGTFQNDIKNKTAFTASNTTSPIAPINKNNQKEEEVYQDTGKKYGDYFYYDYENKKDNKIYKKGNNYYLYDDRTKSYTDINQATNRLSDKKIEKEELEKARKLGYKEQEKKTTKEYDKANLVFKKLQKQYKLSDKELQNFIDKGTLNQKHVSMVTNSMSNLARQAVEYREDIKKGKIKQYDDTVLSISDRLDLDTKGLTKKQRKEFEQDLLRQQKAKDNQYRGVRYGYDGTLSGTLKALVSTKERASDKISREIVAPINNIKENYEYGKKNNELALEYYKKMEGKKNKADKLSKETELYNYFNKDIANNPGWAGTAIQNANTQVESLKKQGIAASILSGVGAVVGTVVEPGAGTVAGAKAGASVGYTLGSTPYTYKLEAGNQYKELLDMGVPDKIAKKHSKRVGAINAAIESGENVVDLLTFNLGGSSKAIPKETVKDLVDEYGDKQVKSWLRKSLGDKVADSMVTAAKSYGQNIVSESIEEMSQEGTSIAGERLAANEGGVKRDKTVKDDLKRILQAGSSAAISTAFTAPISSLGGAIAHNTVTNLQDGISNKITPINNNNDFNNQEIITNEKYSKQIAPTVMRYQETDNQQINNFRQSAVNEGMINNKKTQDVMNLVENVIKEKKYNILFDSTIINTNGQSVDGKISLNEQGQTDIRLNPNSDRAAEFLLTHEITHAIETKELRGLILNFAQKNNEFKTALQDLQKTYNTQDVSDEVVADISAQVLGNQEFINSLQEQNTPQSKNVIKNIYESIKRLLNQMTSKGRYRNFVQDLETKWRDAYRVATNETTKNNLQKIEKYSKVYNNDGTVNRIRINDNVFEGSKDKSISKTIKDYLTKHIGEVYTIIESGQKVYLGKDLPNEYAHSEYTKKLPLNKKLAKGRAVTNLNEIIESATNRTWESNKKEKHKFDAKYGFYKYNTTFSFDYNGSEKIYDGTILIRNDANGKKYLYDILDVKPKKKLVILPLVASNSNKSSAINSGSSNQSANNIPQSNKNVKSDISTKYSMQSKENNTQELDNSSFSYRGSHQIENAKSITDLDLKDIENKIIDIDGYLTKQSESDLNKLKKILKSTDDKVKIYRASPVNELNSGDWVTTDKSYAKNVANENGGKVYEYEVDPKQLYYPDNIKDLPSLHKLSSFQYVETSTNETSTTDSQGRTLSKEQQEFFKDSKIRNDKGELLEVYHGTNNDFTVFDKSYLGSASGDVGFLGDGFYFATHEGEAGYYGGKKIKTYLNVTNPYNIKNLHKYKGMNLRGEDSNPYIEIKNLVDMNPEWKTIKVKYGNTYGDIANATDEILNSISVEDLGETENGRQYKVNVGNKFDIVNTLNNYSIDELKADAFTKEMRYKFGFINSSDVLQNITDEVRIQKLNNQKNMKTFSEVLEQQGYDGVIQGDKASNTDEIVVFNPNQIKNIDNTNPTLNEDIRYSQKSQTWQEHLEKNYKSKGTKTYFDEMRDTTKKAIAPIHKEIKTLSSEIKELKQEINSNKQKETNLPKTNKTQKTNRKEISKRIANTINETIKSDVIVEKQNEVKQRKWIDTALNSEVVDGKIVLEDLDPNKTNYMVQSNKKTLEKANNKLDTMGYDESVKYIQSKMNDSNVSLTDITLAERLIQEAAKSGDKQLASELLMDAAILGTEMGQKIQALSMIQRFTPEGQLKMLQKIVKRSKVMGDQSFQNVEITPEMVEKILDAYDKEGKFNQDDLNRRVEEVKQDIADQLKTTIGEKVDAWRYLAMLGNPTTHIRNMVSNVAMKETIKVKNAIARTIETVAPIKNRTKTWKRATKEIKDYAKTTANEMKDVITGESKYGEKASIEKKKRIFKSKTLETVSNFNSNALEFEDWLFSKSAFTKTFQEYLTAQGIKTKEDIQNNPEIVEKGKLYSVRQAEIATFRQYSKMASTINRLERNSKIAKYPIKATVPFKKTPINVAKAGVNYSPLGLIKNITYDTTQLVKGNIEASQYVDNISQGLTGTSLALLGYALAKAGILNGSGEDDKESKFNSYLGKTGYSIKIGDKYYSLSWLSPVAMPLFVGSNMYEQLEEDKGWDANVVTEALAKTLDPLNEMSFLSGLTDALNSYDKGTDKIKGIGESVMQSYASQFFPTLLSKISSVADDTKRSTQVSSNSSYKFGEQTMRSIMYKIPGLHSKLEPVTDIWGNDVKQDDNVLVRAFENFIAPYSKKEDITTKMDKELKRVYQKVGKSEVIPGFPQSYVTYDKEKYKMSAKEYTQFKKTYGQSANTMLNLLIKDEDYKESADTRKSRMIDKVYDYSRDIAKQEFLKKRKIKINGKDFKYNKTDYEDIIDDILIHTRYLDGE